jgi:LmbE family N-acetylglucosaminyl deacetylase
LKRTVLIAAIAATGVLPHSGAAQAIFNADPPALDLVRLYDGPVPLRVLWIAAHPDDEDTNLIAWLARGRNVNTAYMSLTRGDGGQNLIGNELGEALGVIRTEELLAARRIDGAHQFFGRGYDFGFSKTADETRKHWPQDSLLHDVITVMRAFKPQIVITTFSGTPRDGHGQHQISAIVARDAYNLAGDTIRFPIREYGEPWTPLKFYRLALFSPQDRTIAVNVGEYNPYLGLSYQEIAADSRSQHKSQGQGTLRRKGVVWDYLTREDSRVPAPSAKEERSIFAGLDTNSVRHVVRDGRVIAPYPPLPIELEAVADRQSVALGDSAKISLAIYNRSRGPISIPAIKDGGAARVIQPDSAYRWTQWYVGREISQPWWLATQRNGDLFSPKITGISEDEREVRSGAHIFVSSPEMNRLYLSSPIVFHYVDRVRGDVQRPLIVAPGVSITLDQAITMARANGPFNQVLKTTLRSAMSDSTPVTVTVSLPAGLSADSLSRAVMMAPGGTRTLAFKLRGTLPRGTHEIAATASAKGHAYRSTADLSSVDAYHQRCGCRLAGASQRRVRTGRR